MEGPIKKTISLMSYDQEKSEAEQLVLRKEKPAPEFLIWLTRRKSVEAYMCITLNVANMLQLTGALITYGGVVWVSYLTWAIIIGVPMITAEIALGHYINNEIKYVWGMCRIGKGIFWNCLLSTFAAALVCHVQLAILLHFSFQPYELKVNEFGLLLLTKRANDSNFVNKPPHNNNEQEIFYVFFTDSLTYDYEYLHVPKQQLWVPALYLATICFIMVLLNCKGIRSLEKVTVLFLLVPYLCAVVMAMLIFTLPSAIAYLGRSWHLDWYQLRDISVWLVSFKTVVKGFSIGSLSLMFVSVHSDFHDDIMVDVVILFLNIFLNNVLYTITLLGLFGIIDPIIISGKLANFQDHISILLNVINGLRELPPPKWLWKFLFYSYLIGSAIAQQTLMVASVADAIISLVPKFKTNKFYVTTGICIVFFLLATSIFALEVFKAPSLDTSFLTIALLQSITMFWIYNYERVSADFHFLMGYKPSLFYQCTWVVSPILFLGVIVTELSLLKGTDLVMHNNIYLIILHLSIYIICAIIESFISWKKGEGFNIFRADKSWGPTDPLLKQSRIIFQSRIITKEHIYRQKLYEERLVKPADITHQNIVQLL